MKTKKLDPFLTNEAEHLCFEFNQRHPIGSPVILTYNGEEWPARTASPAHVGDFGLAQIRLRGMLGKHDLREIRPDPEA